MDPGTKRTISQLPSLLTRLSQELEGLTGSLDGGEQTYGSKKEAVEALFEEELPENVTALITEGYTKSSGPLGRTRKSYHLNIEVAQFDDVVEAYTELGDVEDGQRQKLSTKIKTSGQTLAEALQETHEFLHVVQEQKKAYEEAAAEKGL